MPSETSDIHRLTSFSHLAAGCSTDSIWFIMVFFFGADNISKPELDLQLGDSFASFILIWFDINISCAFDAVQIMRKAVKII